MLQGPKEGKEKQRCKKKMGKRKERKSKAVKGGGMRSVAEEADGVDRWVWKEGGGRSRYDKGGADHE